MKNLLTLHWQRMDVADTALVTLNLKIFNKTGYSYT